MGRGSITVLKLIILFMDIKEFVINFELQFDDVEANTITPETIFREIPEWSSLTALLLIAMVDSEYDVTLTGENIRNATTVQELFNVVANKK
jgi:acyl carrier protein